MYDLQRVLQYQIDALLVNNEFQLNHINISVSENVTVLYVTYDAVLLYSIESHVQMENKLVDLTVIISFDYEQIREYLESIGWWEKNDELLFGKKWNQRWSLLDMKLFSNVACAAFSLARRDENQG